MHFPRTQMLNKRERVNENITHRTNSAMFLRKIALRKTTFTIINTAINLLSVNWIQFLTARLCWFNTYK